MTAAGIDHVKVTHIPGHARQDFHQLATAHAISHRNGGKQTDAQPGSCGLALRLPGIGAEPSRRTGFDDIEDQFQTDWVALRTAV